jgi:hypothetical protein
MGRMHERSLIPNQVPHVISGTFNGPRLGRACSSRAELHDTNPNTLRARSNTRPTIRQWATAHKCAGSVTARALKSPPADPLHRSPHLLSFPLTLVTHQQLSRRR